MRVLYSISVGNRPSESRLLAGISLRADPAVRLPAPKLPVTPPLVRNAVLVLLRFESVKLFQLECALRQAVWNLILARMSLPISSKLSLCSASMFIQ